MKNSDETLLLFVRCLGAQDRRHPQVLAVQQPSDAYDLIGHACLNAVEKLIGVIYKQDEKPHGLEHSLEPVANHKGDRSSRHYGPEQTNYTMRQDKTSTLIKKGREQTSVASESSSEHLKEIAPDLLHS